MKKIKIALAGNPNSGKSTIFNSLTGSHQHIANYPGVTVEKKIGKCRYGDYEFQIIDLPGTYSLTAYSDEELIARNYIIEEHPDVVVDIIDASNVERNLYLATQLIELDVPLILAFNMSDVAAQQGIIFDISLLSKLLEAKIIQTVGNKNKGIKELLDAVIEKVNETRTPRIHQINYGDDIETEIRKIQPLLDMDHELVKKYGTRWLAIKLIEQDKDIREKVDSQELLNSVESSISHIENILGEHPQIIIADRRYGFISGACQESIKNTVEMRHSISDKIDAVVTNRILGLPIFLFFMYMVFSLTFKLGKYPMDGLEILFSSLSNLIITIWPEQSFLWLRSLIVDGIISGVGGVIIFLPNILLLFFAIALLEGTGYMARAAFVMDRIMHKIGLHGKSFIPMLIGFGCSVPAIMSTRILENRRNRFTTIMVIPLMSCGARLTIYGLFIPAFFPERLRGIMLLLIYILGIVLAVICAKLLRLTIFKGETIPFVIELPPYRMPTFKSLFIHMWQRGWMYLKKAGTIILGISIILWFAINYPKPNPDALRNLDAETSQQLRLSSSVVGRTGRAIEPIIKPIGFDWKIGTALIGALAAKEVFVSQLAIVYASGSVEQDTKSLRQKLQANYSSLTAFCVMLFCLISAPCVATIAMTRQETNSWLWASFQFIALTTMAYVITLITYQLGSLFLS